MSKNKAKESAKKERSVQEKTDKVDSQNRALPGPTLSSCVDHDIGVAVRGRYTDVGVRIAIDKVR